MKMPRKSSRFGRVSRLADMFMKITPRSIFLLTFFAASLVVAAPETSPADSGAGNSIIGFSEPVEAVDLSVAEAGIVEAMEVKEGDAVKAGQVLGRLDTRILQSSLRIAELKAGSEALVKSAQIRRDLRESRFKKIEQLKSSQSANAEELERAKADWSVAEAELETAQEEKKSSQLEVERIRATIEARTIRSPIDGEVSRILRDVGESVDARTEHIINVVRLDRLRVIIYVPPKAALQIKSKKTLPVRSLATDETLQATVEFVSPVTEPASGTVRIKLLLDNAERKHISGTKFSVSIGESQ